MKESKFINGKKGDEKVLFIFMVLIWIIVLVSLMYGIYLVYGEDKDIKEVEANAILNKLSKCIIINGNLNSEISNDNNFSNQCNVNLKELGKNEYFVNISVDYYMKDEEVFEDIIYGNKDLVIQCVLREGTEAKNYARCIERSLKTMYKGEKVNVNIFVGANNAGRRF